MTTKYLKGDFEFPREFGFSGSSMGRHDARPHPVQGNDEYGAQGKARGGQPKVVTPGKAPQPMIPLSTAANAAKGALALGLGRGARMARQPRSPAPAPGPAPAAMPTEAPAMTPAMAKGGFLKTAVKRPGRMKRLAAQHGMSLGEEIAKDKHSKDPSLRAAANLGARFRSGEFRHKKGK